MFCARHVVESAVFVDATAQRDHVLCASWRDVCIYKSLQQYKEVWTVRLQSLITQPYQQQEVRRVTGARCNRHVLPLKSQKLYVQLLSQEYRERLHNIECKRNLYFRTEWYVLASFPNTSSLTQKYTTTAVVPAIGYRILRSR